ncbi:MAG: anti-sigma factor [Actinobacteria bacterium]|nr:anti-sigma factor [Actinomycetota bacterium]
MSEHAFDELPRLLSGDADRSTVLDAAAHLRSCEDCRDELVSAVVAHAALMSSTRLAPGLLPRDIPDDASAHQPRNAPGDAPGAGPGVVPGDTPGPVPRDLPGDAPTTVPSDVPSDVPSGIPSAVPASRPSDVHGLIPGAEQLPDLSAVFAQIRAETAAPAERGTDEEPGPRGSRRGLVLVAAAVIGLGVGVGGVYAGQQLDGSSQSSQTVALAAFGHGTVPAKAVVVGGDRMKLDATSLPSPGSDHLYEVWLTNSARTRMYAVGSLGADRIGTFTVSPDLMSNYSAIEVSVQSTQDSAYSGVSVLRGSY